MQRSETWGLSGACFATMVRMQRLASVDGAKRSSAGSSKRVAPCDSAADSHSATPRSVAPQRWRDARNAPLSASTFVAKRKRVQCTTANNTMQWRCTTATVTMMLCRSREKNKPSVSERPKRAQPNQSALTRFSCRVLTLTFNFPDLPIRRSDIRHPSRAQGVNTSSLQLLILDSLTAARFSICDHAPCITHSRLGGANEVRISVAQAHFSILTQNAGTHM